MFLNVSAFSFEVSFDVISWYFDHLENRIGPAWYNPSFNFAHVFCPLTTTRSEEHTSELQSLMRISYAAFCLKKKNILHISNPLENTLHVDYYIILISL